MQISYCIRPEISSTDYLWKDKAGYRTNDTKSMQVKVCGDNLSGSV